MRALIASLLGLAVLNAPAARAADQSNGCGLGWYVTTRMSLLATSTRGTTNYFLPNTFSMTSGTSGCAQHSIVMRDKQGLHFLEANYEQLQVDIARGTGEHLGAFAQAVGCHWTAYDDFRQTMQSHFDTLYRDAAGSSGAVLGRVHEIIDASPKLARNCNHA